MSDTHEHTTPQQRALHLMRGERNSAFDDFNRAASRGPLSEVRSILPLISPLSPDLDNADIATVRNTLKTVVTNGHHDVLAAILAADAQVSQFKYSCYAVEEAADRNDFEALQAFLDAGWDINESGFTLTKRPMLRHTLKNPSVRRWLLEHGADPHGQDQWSLTNLEAAAVHSDPAVVEDLIEHGGDPAKDDSLILAVEWGNLTVAELLLGKGALVNKPEKDAPMPAEPQRRRNTALHKALMPAISQPQLLDLLLRYDADVHATNALGQTPLSGAKQIAQRMGNNLLLEKLMAHEASRARLAG